MREREIIIRLRFPATLGKRWFLGALAVVICGSAIAYAAGVTQFKTGDTLSASALNTNFNAVAAVTRNGHSFSLNAAYCGSATTTTLPTTGYAGMKTLCETACSSPTAHMCTGEEMVRSAQLSVTLPATGWYSSGIFASDATVNPTIDVIDCLGWTTAASGYEGAAWTNGTPNGHYCSAPNVPVLCCD